MIKISIVDCNTILLHAENLDSQEIVPTQKVNSDNLSTLALILYQRVIKIQLYFPNMAQNVIVIE